MKCIRMQTLIIVIIIIISDVLEIIITSTKQYWAHLSISIYILYILQEQETTTTSPFFVGIVSHTFGIFRLLYDQHHVPDDEKKNCIVELKVAATSISFSFL